MPRATKTPRTRHTRPSALASGNCSATAKRFKELLASAKRHPAYWLEGLLLDHMERMTLLKIELARTAHWNDQKQVRLRGKISELANCLRTVQAAMEESEKLPNEKGQR